MSKVTACEQYVNENLEVLSGFTVTIRGGEIATLRVRSCRGPVRLLVFIDRESGGARQLVADASDVVEQWREISLQALVNSSPGENFVLMWVMDGPADDWQVVSEVVLNETVHYRHLKRRRPGVMNGEILNIKVRQ